MRVLPARPNRPPAPPRCPPFPAARLRASVRLFRALGDPARLRIFRLLAEAGTPVCVCDLVARIGLSQPTVSHHLRVLREAGLVTARRKGVWTRATVAPGGAGLLREALCCVRPGGEGPR